MIQHLQDIWTEELVGLTHLNKVLLADLQPDMFQKEWNAHATRILVFQLIPGMCSDSRYVQWFQVCAVIPGMCTCIPNSMAFYLQGFDIYSRHFRKKII